MENMSYCVKSVLSDTKTTIQVNICCSNLEPCCQSNTVCCEPEILCDTDEKTVEIVE